VDGYDSGRQVLTRKANAISDRVMRKGGAGISTGEVLCGIVEVREAGKPIYCNAVGYEKMNSAMHLRSVVFHLNYLQIALCVMHLG